MKLELEVLASTSIKRKKPWPRLAWIGEAQESIFLVDDHRLSVLYVPSGKTRRRVNKLQPLLEDVTTLSHSENGQFMVGLLRSGDVFLWHKDTDMLKYIQGLPDLARSLPNVSNNANSPAMHLEPPKPCISIADDGTKIAVVMNRSRLFVWEQDADQVLFAAKRIDVKGSWTEVKPSRAVSIPDPAARETAITSVFFINDVLGLCCMCSLIFTVDSSVCVTTAVMRWYETQNIMTYSKPTFTVEWTNLKSPICDLVPGGGPVRASGTYLGRYSHDGHLLAVAVNQKSSHLNRLLFVSPLTDTLVVSDLKGTGAKIPVTRAYRTYWVTDLAWTADDLFVIVMTKQGSIAMVSRLGEPVLLRTFGCSLDMGPRFFLPLHPLISVKPSAGNDPSASPDDHVDLEAQAVADQDPMRQRFSLSCHPRLPIFLCSDGYMVTALQLPADLSCLSLMKGLVMESNHHLRRVRDQQKISLTLYDSMRRQGRVTKKLSLSNGVVGGRRMINGVNTRKETNEPYRFEEPEDDALNNSLDDEGGDFGVFGTEIPTGNMDNGKIFFGDLDNLTTSVDNLEASGTLEENLSVVQLMEKAQNTLLLAWSLGASHTGLWTEEHEDVATNIAHNLLRLFTLLLQSSPDVARELLTERPQSRPVKNPRLARVLHILRTLLHILRLDAPQQHLMVCSVRLAHSALRLLLTDPHLLKVEPRLNTLHGSFTLLTCMEQVFSGIYSCLPKTAVVNSLSISVQQESLALFEPPTLCNYRVHGYNNKQDIGDIKPRYEMSGVPPEQKKLIRPLPTDDEQDEHLGIYLGKSEIIKRLGPAWRLLYKHTVSLYKSVSSKKCKGKVRKLIHDLLVTLQVKLTTIGQGHVLVPTKRIKVQPGNRLSIEGCSSPALKAWMYQLNMPQDTMSSSGVVGRLLLSTLYSLLVQDDLRAAIELTELLLRQPDVRSAAAIGRQDVAKKWTTLAMLQQDTDTTSPPKYIQNQAVLAVVRSVARVMAAYFSNQTLFVFPPHAPRVIPPLHKTCNIKHRVIPLYHESLATVVRQDGLDGIWTAERAMQYLLLSGLVQEATWFADTLGDWKTAFTLGVAQSEHYRTVPALYQAHTQKLEIPESLRPDTVLQAKLAQSFGLKVNSTGGLLIDEETDLPQLRRVLADLMLAAVLSRVDLVPWLLEGLVGRLRQVTAQFGAIVPPGLYLPAPPVYCPQPANTSQAALSEDDSHEVALRHEASSLIQLVLLILEGANCTLPAARWYSTKVQEAVINGRRFKADVTGQSPDVPVLQASFLGVDSSFFGREHEPSIRRILSALRDLCGLVWLLYVRDKLSLGLRKKLQLVERKMKKSPAPVESWLKHCRETLHWAACLVPFAHFLQAEDDIFGITLSLITELPTDEHACQLLCQFFYDAESLDPELQDKLQVVLKDWQGVFLDPATPLPTTPREAGTAARPAGETPAVRDMRKSGRSTGKSPRGTSLSFYFHKQAQRMEKHFRKKAKVFGEYEVFVFDPETEEKEREAVSSSGRDASYGIEFIGSRPFESEDSYLEFLDVFYAVSFHKNLDAEEKEAAPAMPLLSASSATFRQRELSSLAHKAVISLSRKQQLSAASTASAPVSPRRTTSDLGHSNLSFSTSSPAPSRSRLPSSPRSAKVGLFRSRSFSELSHKRSQLPPMSPAMGKKRKSSSHQDLSALSADEEDFLEVHAAKPMSASVGPGVGGGTSPRGRARYAQSRQLSGSDTLLTVDGVVPKMTLAQRCAIRRSSSVNDVDDARKVRQQSKAAKSSSSKALPAEDPLLNPVIPAGLLERLEFGTSFSELEQLLEWLSRWAGRNHTLTTRPEHQVISGNLSLSASQNSLGHSQQGSPVKDLGTSLKGAPLPAATVAKPAMRIKVHPRMVVYSLWLIENQYYSDRAPPPVASKPPAATDTPPAAPVQTRPSQLENLTATLPEPQDRVLNLAEPDDRLRAELNPEKEQEHPEIRWETLSQFGEESDHKELEESYRQQIISAESNESLSDGFIPGPKKKKMGILKKKKKDKKKKEEEKEEPKESVATSDTLMRRLSFKLTDNEPTATPHNVSQVSDSTLNVSSLNDEELPDTMRQTLTQINPSTKTPTRKQPSRKQDPSQPGPSRVERAVAQTLGTDAPDARLLDNMSAPAVEDSDQEDTRLDLRPLQTQQTEGDDLRSMVRQELRKIVQAQHRGIMAMLGALGEDEEEDGPVGASTPHDRSGRKDRGRHQIKRKMPRQHQADHHHDLNFTQDTSFNDRSSLTEVDVTPLPSDEVSLKSMNDRPLTVSDLFKSKTWSPGARYEPSEVGNNVRGALKELKTLENSQTSPNHVHFNFDNQMNGTSPGRMVATPSGKENVHAGFQGQPVKGQSQYQNQGPYGQGQGPMTTKNQAPYQQHPLGFGQEPPHPDQPFSRVFQMLKVMNQNLAQSNTGSGTQSRNVTMTDLGGPGPRLLHVPGPGPQPVRFPPVPSSTTPAARHALPPGGGVGRMPLLHVYAPHRTDEVPVREVTAHHLPPTTHHQHPAPAAGPAQVPFRMPLLKLAPTPQRRVFNHIEDEHGDLRLVPAEDVLAYEARRQEERRQKLEQRRQQMEALGLSGPPVEAMLKKAERRDQRQSDRRKQRRQRVDEDDPMRTSRENLSTAIRLSRAAHQADQGTAEQGLETMSQHVQVDGPEMMTQEVQVTYTPTPREQNTCGVQYPTPRTGSVDREDDGEETEEDQESEELDRLHHGYALTPVLGSSGGKKEKSHNEVHGKKGLFDEYLMKDGEMGSAQDSAARLHYRAAVGLRPKKLKEVGTGTDGPGWTDTGTITCRDQGTDPVAEALESYMRAKRNLQAGGFVAPDVFMGLKFSENGHTAATGSNEQGGAAKRAFINVVDLDGSALADMVTSLPQRDQQRPATAPSQRKERAKRPPSGRATDPPRSRVEPAEEGEEEEDDELTGPDRVTAKVLGQRSARDGQPDAGPSSSRIRGHTKDSIRSKLEDMDMQFDAIEAMSRNMENDYKNAKLMIHTIEQMGEAIHPTPPIPHEESPEPTHRGLETSDREDDELTTHLKPSHIGKFHREDKQKQASPRRMQHEPLAETGEEEEGGLSVRDRVSDIRSRLGLSEDMGDDPDEESRPEPGYRDNADEGVPDASGLDITGLSGVSDIIGEVIASGRVDTASLGLTDRQARKLISKAPSGRDAHTINDLQKSGENKRILEERARKRTEKEKEELRSWMEDKRRQRFTDFKNQQQELREREKYPYRPTDDSGQMSTMTFKELEEWEKKRISSKKELEQYNAEMRRKAASELMGDMLTERPDLPPEPLPERRSARRQTAPTGRPGQRTTSTSPARRDKSYSPARRGASRSPARVRPGMQKPTQKSAWNTDPDKTNLHVDDYRHVRDSKDYDRQFRHSGPQQRDQGFVQSGTMQRESAFAHSGHMSGHLSGALNTQTGTSSAGLRAYTRHLEDVQDSFEPDSEIKDATQPGEQTEAGQPVYKPKPYTEKVRVQRPEVTRQNRPRPAAKPYVERLSETSQTMNTPRSNTAADRLSQERLYGTKRIPGSQASRVGPRTVKTYQERLKEMKQARTAQLGPIRRYTGPIPGNATVTRSTARPMRRVIKPKKKPMTYSEQLKALQPPKELYRTGTVEIPSMTRSQTRGRGRRGPPHKPMTYQEQLQQLQPPKELYRTSLGGTAEYQDSMRSPRVHRTPPQHPLRRSGPYPDPYRPPPEEDVDRASMVSPWDMEDNVRRLLYDDGASSHVGASRTGTDIDMSELQELAGLEDDPYYTDLVDVQEIADVASVSEGSIMSFIDWDQVNDLIADVY